MFLRNEVSREFYLLFHRLRLDYPERLRIYRTVPAFIENDSLSVESGLRSSQVIDNRGITMIYLNLRTARPNGVTTSFLFADIDKR